MSDNLRFYARGAEPPPEACKKFTRSGGFSGTDINAMWRIKTLTEIFGPVGFGWKSTSTFHTETYSETDVRIYCDLLLYVKDPETREWSAPIEGYGGNSVVSIRQGKPFVNDECFKMAETDALGSACKKIGIGARIYWESDRSKYTMDDDGNVEITTKTEAEVKAERRQANAEKAKADPFLTASKIPKLKDMVAAIEQANKTAIGMGIVGKFEAINGPDITSWSGDAIRACYDEIQEASQ